MVNYGEQGNESIVIQMVKYIQRMAYSGNLVEYIGVAQPGSLTSESKWQIRKMSYSGNLTTAILFADGNTNFDNIWDNRASLSYS